MCIVVLYCIKVATLEFSHACFTAVTNNLCDVALLALSCPTPTVPENSIMKGNNFTYGSKVTFRYHLHPQQHHVVLLTVENVVEVFLLTSVSVFTHLSCIKGFLPQIPYEYQCLTSLRWSGTPPACYPVTCGGPPNIGNAEYTLNTNTYLSTVKYTCAEGYRYGFVL